MLDHCCCGAADYGISGIAPPLAPAIGIGMIVGGIIVWRKNMIRL
jgi:hypothetical protein